MNPNERDDQIESVELSEDELDDITAGGPAALKPTPVPGT